MYIINFRQRRRSTYSSQLLGLLPGTEIGGTILIAIQKLKKLNAGFQSAIMDLERGRACLAASLHVPVYCHP